ncbi:MAG: hypothetical protein FD135_268 [Comamonadaceae bacterium]|nr:MAG: hypothetical protein FD135_268 [Comamonadaceae bacterium]
MMMKHVCFCVILFLLPVFSFSQDLWKLEKEGDGIKIYTRLEAGSPYKSFKAVTEVTANRGSIADILRDVNGYVNWFAFTEKVKLLESSDLNNKYVYIETQFPWPFGNEDMIYKITFSTEGNVLTKVTMIGVPDYLPPVTGIGRMKKVNGYILLKPVGDATEVTYCMHSDLGGNIPAWMANQYIDNLPYQTLLKFKKLLLDYPATKANLAFK